MLLENIPCVSLDTVFAGAPNRRRRRYRLVSHRYPGGREFGKPSRGAGVSPLENAMPPIEQREQLRPTRQAFGGTQKKDASRLQSIVKASHGSVLQISVEIDHQVAAGDHVQPGKRRVSNDAVNRKDAHLADLLDRAISVPARREPSFDPFRRHTGHGSGIKRGPSGRHGAVVDVGSEQLDRARNAAAHHFLRQQNRDGINFLARGAGRRPDAERIAGRLRVEQRRQTFRTQGFEGFGVAEEMRHPDQKLAKKQIELRRVLTQPVDIFRYFLDVQNLHSPLNASGQGAALVLPEIVSNRCAQQSADCREMIFHVPAGAIAVFERRDAFQVSRVLAELRRHLVDLHHVIDQPGGGSALGHAAESHMVEARLGESETAMRLDRAYTVGPVTAGSR
ncbi:MAG TPA: hypothetical protein VGH40_01935 [Roseiarcus sp.]